MEENCAVTLPRLGEPAPDFEAMSTHGKLSLAGYRGRWVVLFSHPADFTPVCTTEFVALSAIAEDLARRNTQLVGLSVDSIYSHIAWLRNIKEKLGTEIAFPVIADLDMKIARLYGMIHEKMSATSAVRSLFIIDDKGILRAMIYYPLTTGRNMDEIMRLIVALQAADEHKIATPANWRPGDKVIIPAPVTTDGAKIRVSEGFECVDWYLCRKTIPVK
jgi:peroxiredoxin (alkyl hydroperoxide reductase subunit C)